MARILCVALAPSHTCSELASTPTQNPSSSRSAAQAAYLDSRFAPDPRRDRAWKPIVAYLSRFWDRTDADILDVGSGYCSFINFAVGRRRVAVDIHDRLAEHAGEGVEHFVASATDLSIFPSSSFDVVFASNVLEHLARDEIQQALAEFRRVLRPGGRVILLQPNFRHCASRYYDDYTHLTPLSDKSLGDLLTIADFRLVCVQSRFLPLTVKSRVGSLTFLVPLYLRLPWRPLAGQMLLIGEVPKKVE
jgi:SAM-dependent methyltransferase